MANLKMHLARKRPLRDSGLPDYFEFAKAFLGSRLKRVMNGESPDFEATRANSFEALNALANALRDEKGDKKVGLLEKRGGARVRDRASDVIAWNKGDGTCQLFDCIGDSEGEDGTPRVGWGVIGEHEAGIRPMEQWKLPYGATDTDGEVPEITHRYVGGGNDNGTCDQCGQNKMAPVHRVPEGKVVHQPWQGEDGKGDCDICMRPVNDPIHVTVVPGENGDSLTVRLNVVEARQAEVVSTLTRLSERLTAVESGGSGGGLDEPAVKAIVAALLKDITVEVDVQEAGPSVSIFGQRINLKHDHGVAARVKFGPTEVSRAERPQLVENADHRIDGPNDEAPRKRQ